MDKTYYLIVGTRTFDDYEKLNSELDKYITKDSVIVSGGAKGADYLAKKYANDNGIEYIEFKAEWNKYGKAAGNIRNRQMHEFISRMSKRKCIMFWDGISKGTKQSISLADEYNNPLQIIYY